MKNPTVVRGVHAVRAAEVRPTEFADLILAELDLPDTLKTIVPDRPSHDRRYLLDSTKLRTELGWTPRIGFTDGIADTVAWYRESPGWWQPLLGRSPVQEARWVPSAAARSTAHCPGGAR